MANDITGPINSVFVDGPSSNPTPVDKPGVRTIVGPAIQTAVDDLRTETADIRSLIAIAAQPKEKVVFRSTSTGAIATAFVNGTTHDGHVAVTGERFFMDGRTDPKENGLRLVPASGAPARTTDADTGAELLGAEFFVQKGTVSAGQIYRCSNTTAPTIGVDNITFIDWAEYDQAALNSKQDHSANLDDWSLAPAAIIPATGDYSIPNFVTDETGFVISSGVYTKPNGTVVTPFYDIVAGDYSVLNFSTDEPGFVIPQASSSGGGTSADVDERAMFDAQDAYAAAYSAAVPYRPLPAIAGLWWDYVLFMDYGQSISQGGASPLPKTVSIPSFGISAKMVGYSTRSSDESDTYVAFGSTVNANGVETQTTGPFALRDMVATSDIDKDGGGSVYDYTSWVISPDAGHNGEAPVVSWVYAMWKHVNEERNEITGNFGARIPIGATQGFGGKTIAELTSTSPSGSEDFAPRLRMQNFSTQLAAHIPATYSGKTVGFVAWQKIQGEADAAGTSKADYKTGLGVEKAMMDAVASGTFLQPASPAMFIVQTGQHWVRGVSNIPQAQHEFALENQDDGVWITCNTFNVPGKFEVPASPGFTALPSTTDFTSTTLNEHKDGNATRWISSYTEKVSTEIIWKRRNWQHMHIVKGQRKPGSRFVCVSWHTPVAPIRSLHCWQGYRKVTMPQNGVQFFQAGSEVTITGTEFRDQSIIFELDVVPTSGVALDIHVGVDEGRHNIADSDPSVSRFSYDYSHQDFAAFDPVEANMTAGEILVNNEALAELADYIDNPYPLPNYAAIEVFTITEVE